MDTTGAPMPVELADPAGGIRVPRWAVVAITVAVTLIGSGVAYGRAAAQRDNHDQLVDYRLCRIEHALNIEPWSGCPEPQQIRGGAAVR